MARTVEVKFLKSKGNYVSIKEVGDQFTGSFVRVQDDPVEKEIKGTIHVMLRYEFKDHTDGVVKTFDTKATYLIKKLSQLEEGDVVTLKKIENEEGKPRVSVVTENDAPKKSKKDEPEEEEAAPRRLSKKERRAKNGKKAPF